LLYKIEDIQKYMNQNLQHIWQKRPLIISGPCSAETEEQLLQTCQQLAATNQVNVLRAGIWKPRTKPGLFEGIGEIGLSWLAEAKKLTGLPTTVEVATAAHVEAALKNNVDILWIGARTTVNPFSVQEVADALKGVDIPVLVKNPINPDLELWTGAIERLQKVGIENIGLIHRGFSSYGNTEYRNAPMWHLPVEMKRRFAEMLLICDPSHICGNRHMLQMVAQKSIDLEFSGLIIESHIDPDNAWSDAKQQITPSVLVQMLTDLQWRTLSSNTDEHTDLALLRERIDQIDDELLNLLSRRMNVADLIGDYKKEHNLTILQTQRWNNILNKGLSKAEVLQLSKEFIVKFFDAVHWESIAHQNKVMNSKGQKLEA
jgi:chorismate mutase